MKASGALLIGLVAAMAAGSIGAEEVQRMTGFIAGDLSYPGEAIPALAVVARSLDDRRDFTLRTKENQRRYRLRVPAGRYHVFAIPDGNRDPLLRGAYTATRSATTSSAVAARRSHAARPARCSRSPCTPARRRPTSTSTTGI